MTQVWVGLVILDLSPLEAFMWWMGRNKTQNLLIVGSSHQHNWSQLSSAYIRKCSRVGQVHYKGKSTQQLKLSLLIRFRDNSNYVYRTDSYFCTTSLLNVHKPSKLKVGRVRNSGTHVLKTIHELISCIFSLSSSGFQTFFW